MVSVRSIYTLTHTMVRSKPCLNARVGSAAPSCSPNTTVEEAGSFRCIRAEVQPISMPVSVFVLRVARYELLSVCSDASSSVECMELTVGYRALDARDPV